MRRRVSLVGRAVRVAVMLFTVSLMAATSHAQVWFSEDFEGNASKYDIGDESYVGPGEFEWSPGIWGLNTIGEQIGQVRNSPARRAAILFDHEPFADQFADEAYAVFTTLADWALSIENDTTQRANKKVGFYDGYFEESVEAVKNTMVANGFREANLIEIFDPAEAVPANVDLVIQSSVPPEFAGFSGLEVPLISFESSSLDDSAISGIGTRQVYDDIVTLQIPVAARNHPALGGLGVNGTIPWTTEEMITLSGIGKTHNGGTTIAQVIDPATGELAPAIYVIEKGAPLLGAFNPKPQGSKYLVGSALNKIGDTLERVLSFNVDLTGKTDVNMTVKLAATAADFETGDYLILEVDPDGDGPKGITVLDEFYGVDSPGSACHKGLSNGDVAGQVGPICLPTEAFGDFSWPVPAGATNAKFQFRLITTWGNEIIGIDDIRVHSGALGPNFDFDGDGSLGVGDIDELSKALNGNSTDLKFDVNADGVVGPGDLDEFVTAKEYFNTYIGDADLNGEFGSADFVTTFLAGEYEDGDNDNSTWAEGDWNGDLDFTSSDFVAAFLGGGYEVGPRQAIASVPEPSSAVLLLIGLLALGRRTRRN